MNDYYFIRTYLKDIISSIFQNSAYWLWICNLITCFRTVRLKFCINATLTQYFCNVFGNFYCFFRFRWLFLHNIPCNMKLSSHRKIVFLEGNAPYRLTKFSSKLLTFLPLLTYAFYVLHFMFDGSTLYWYWQHR